MAKSKLRKGRKIVKPRDASGKIITKNSRQKAPNAAMNRTFIIQDACKSLTLEEVKDIFKAIKDRSQSTETIKGPKPTLSYISTVLNEKGVPISGETKEISVGNADIRRLKAVIQFKEQAMKQQEEKNKKEPDVKLKT